MIKRDPNIVREEIAQLINENNSKWSNFPSQKLANRCVMFVFTMLYMLLGTIMTFICKFLLAAFYLKVTAHAAVVHYARNSDVPWGQSGGGISQAQMQVFYAKCSQIFEPFSQFMVNHPFIAFDSVFIASVLILTIEVIPEVIKAVTVVTMPVGALAVGATVAGTTVIAGASATGIPGISTVAAIFTTAGFIVIKGVQMHPMGSQEFIALAATCSFFGYSAIKGAVIVSSAALGGGVLVGGVAVTTGVAVASLVTGYSFGLQLSSTALWTAYTYIGVVASSALYGTVGKSMLSAASKKNSLGGVEEVQVSKNLVASSVETPQIALNSSAQILVDNADIIVAATSEFESLLIYTMSWW